MEKFKNFIFYHSDNILIIVCLVLAFLFSTLLGNIMDIYNITSLHRVIMTAFSVFSLTLIDTAFQTYKHKSKK